MSFGKESICKYDKIDFFIDMKDGYKATHVMVISDAGGNRPTRIAIMDRYCLRELGDLRVIDNNDTSCVEAGLGQSQLRVNVNIPEDMNRNICVRVENDGSRYSDTDAEVFVFGVRVFGKRI